ncbi:MAG: 50S ribosomal protein L31 [bacterium]
MKKGIHPQYHQEVQVNCICGNSFTISSTIPGPVKVESCPACHPAYNKGLQIKQVSKGRMEKFAEKMKKIESAKTSSAKAPAKTVKKAAPKSKE